MDWYIIYIFSLFSYRIDGMWWVMEADALIYLMLMGLWSVRFMVFYLNKVSWVWLLNSCPLILLVSLMESSFVFFVVHNLCGWILWWIKLDFSFEDIESTFFRWLYYEWLHKIIFGSIRIVSRQDLSMCTLSYLFL